MKTKLKLLCVVISIVVILVGGYFFLILNGWSPYYEGFDMYIEKVHPNLDSKGNSIPLKIITEEDLMHVPKFHFMAEALLKEKQRPIGERPDWTSAHFTLDSTLTPYRINYGSPIAGLSISTSMSDSELQQYRDWLTDNDVKQGFIYKEVSFSIGGFIA